jgi:hypothetical protein
VIRLSWSKEASKNLRPALKGKSHSIIKKEVLNGESALFLSNRIWLVLRPEGRELVLVAAAGEGLLKATESVYQFAKQHGYQSIRFHTKQTKLNSVLKKWPIKLIEVRPRLLGNEYVYRMAV